MKILYPIICTMIFACLIGCGHKASYGFLSQTVLDEDMQVHLFYGESNFDSESCFMHYMFDE